MEIDAGAVLDLFPGQIHLQMQRAPRRMPQGYRRDEDFFPREQNAGRHHDIADDPLTVIEVKIVHVSNIGIDGRDGIAA
ncbi:MAG: hypothetical protein M3Y13_07640 [Armatimonadota bacterium]|nr:hypothetical protein [Armatimonadota bacterium]